MLVYTSYPLYKQAVPDEYFDFDTIEPGMSLGTWEFAYTDELLALHRRAVEDPEAFFFTNQLKAGTFLVYRRWAARPGHRHVNARHTAEYFNPPRPGTTLVVSGKISDKYVKRDKPYVVFETEIRDTTGMLIERYWTTRMVQASKAGEKWWGRANADTPIGFELPGVSKLITLDKIRTFEALGARPENLHTNAEIAAEEGMGEPIASAHHTISYAHELLNKFFGPDWVRGGKLDLKFLRPVKPGDTLSLKGIVKNKEVVDGRMRLGLEVWAENQNGLKTAAGEASAFVS
jgi:acyl dehydratase